MPYENQTKMDIIFWQHLKSASFGNPDTLLPFELKTSLVFGPSTVIIIFDGCSQSIKQFFMAVSNPLKGFSIHPSPTQDFLKTIITVFVVFMIFLFRICYNFDKFII